MKSVQEQPLPVRSRRIHGESRPRRVPDRELLARASYRLDFEQTGGGVIARLAHFVFDPLFFVLRWFSLALIRW